MTITTFKVWDYSFFAGTLLVSTIHGIVISVKNKTRESSKACGDSRVRDFYYGNRNLWPVPVALSMIASACSGYSLLGIPVEIYERGLSMWVFQLMGLPALLLIAIVFVPFFYALVDHVVSIYSYFSFRFQDSKAVRRLCAVLFLVNSLFYMAVSIYSPAEALAAATGVPAWPFIFALGFVCVLYTSLGGIRAVVWTDAVQAVLMYIGLIILVVKGSWDAGGVGAVVRHAAALNRHRPLGVLDPSPFQYSNIWIIVIGGLFFRAQHYGLNQMAVQRFTSVSSVNLARWVLAMTGVGTLLMQSLCAYLGLLMLHKYSDADPIRNGSIKNKDQLVIFYVLQTLTRWQDFRGLFLACMFSATLSTVSTCLNSCAAVFWEEFFYTDVIWPWKYAKWQRKLRGMAVEPQNQNAHRSMLTPNPQRCAQKALLYGQMLVTGFGALSIATSFAIGPSGGTVAAGLGAMSAFGGPLIGIFVLSLFFPKTTSQGALCGLISSVLSVFSLAVLTSIHAPYRQHHLGFHIGDTYNRTAIGHYGDPGVFILLKIPPFIYSALSALLVILVGLPASYIWRHYNKEKAAEADGTLNMHELWGMNLVFRCGAWRCPRKRPETPEQSSIEMSFRPNVS